jgi:predicted MFS family arabinose efflux permease
MPSSTTRWSVSTASSRWSKVSDTAPARALDHRVRGARWGLLFAFAALAASTQVLWLSFAPVTTRAADVLGVSDGAIGDLAVVNPVLYVLLAIPAGRWADRRFGLALSTGAGLTAVGALLRAVKPDSYGWVLAGQLVLSAGQPLVLNATTKVAARWFPATERTRAIAVGSGAQFLGILVAATTAGPLLDAGGLSLLLGAYAAFATAGALALVVTLALVPPAFAPDAGPAPSLSWLRHDRLLLKLAAMLFVGVGLFNALATWLDPILEDLGMPGSGGTLIAITTIAGLVGTAVLPDLASRRDKRRTVLLVTTVLAVVAFPLVSVLPTVWLVGAALAVVGFFLLAGLPIALDWSELAAGPERAATATGFLLLAGNLGGAILVLVVQVVVGNPYLALGAFALLAVPGVLVARKLPDHAGAHRDDESSATPDPAR